jgi:PTS system glucitol/sorbitol-specific IIA component
MEVVYKTLINGMGKNASEFIEHDMFVTFKDNAPEELKDYCYLHSENDLAKDIQIDDTLFLGERSYKVTAVGSEVNKNLRELGHITFKFSGETTAEIAGTLFLEKKEIVPPENGTIIKIIRN